MYILYSSDTRPTFMLVWRCVQRTRIFLAVVVLTIVTCQANFRCCNFEISPIFRHEYVSTYTFSVIIRLCCRWTEQGGVDCLVLTIEPVIIIARVARYRNGSQFFSKIFNVI